MEKLSNAELIAVNRRCMNMRTDEGCPDCVVYEQCSHGQHPGEALCKRLEELIRPGRWIYWRDGQNRLWCKCSLCSKTYGCLDTPFCPNCGHPMMDEELELRTCYCPICDKHFEVRSYDSGGSCPDCGHHVVLHRVEVAE